MDDERRIDRAMNFYVAMRGEMQQGSYERPDRASMMEETIFIVARISRGTQRMSILRPDSFALENSGVPTRPLAGATVTGTLTWTGEGRNSETFLLDRDPPDDIAVDGTFQSAEGYARLDYRAEDIVLEAAGRDPARREASWRIRARYIFWANEIKE